ncbi:MAG: glutamate racemase [Clostridia bacterium]|nr:glutamate racemase [Clostridia bacterium]
MSDRRPVGVFDSGVGGLSVLAALEKELPGERFIYYGDTAYAPYGTKTDTEVLGRAEAVTELLLAQGAKAVVIACNTATAAAAHVLRAERPELPIVAMEPALKPAAQSRHGGSILVLATPMTLRLNKFQRLMADWGEGAVPVPCPGLMELVERMDWEAAGVYVTETLERFRERKIDAVVLGCTHYVFLRPLLRELTEGKDILIVDGNAGTARQLRRVLESKNALSGAEKGGTVLQTSGEEAGALPVMERLLAFAREKL